MALNNKTNKQNKLCTHCNNSCSCILNLQHYYKCTELLSLPFLISGNHFSVYFYNICMYIISYFHTFVNMCMENYLCIRSNFYMTDRDKDMPSYQMGCDCLKCFVSFCSLRIEIPPIRGAFNNVSARRATKHTPPERERSPARQEALATQADSCVALYIQHGDRTNNF